MIEAVNLIISIGSRGYMKFLFILLMTISSVFAAPGDVLLTCNDTSILNLKQIVITQGTQESILITETDSDNKITTSKGFLSDFENNKILLSEMFSYSRKLYKDDFGWVISLEDECTSNSYDVICK